MSPNTSKLVAALNLEPKQVEEIYKLFSSKMPIPFMAKFQKHICGGLKDYQLRQLKACCEYDEDFLARKKAIIEAIEKQGTLTNEVRQQIEHSQDKQNLLDIFYPFRPERKNLAHLAKVAIGNDILKKLLTPYASINDCCDAIESTPNNLTVEAKTKHLSITLAYSVIDNALLMKKIRHLIWQHGLVKSQIIKGKENAARLLKEQVQFEKKFTKVSVQEALAIFNGRKEGITSLDVLLSDDAPILQILTDHFSNIHKVQGQWFDTLLVQSIKQYILPKISIELLNKLKDEAENQTLKSLTKQLYQQISLSPAGHTNTMGIINAYKAGIKVVVIDGNGCLLDFTTIFPFPPNGDWHDAQITLAKLITKHEVKNVAIGQRSGAKEILRLINELNDTYQDLSLVKMILSEAGCRYVAEHTQHDDRYALLDEWQRGAVSLAKRLQDPLLELSTIPFSAIDIGLNQAAINPLKISNAFRVVFEDYINKIGLDINSAPLSLLMHIAGLNLTDADKIIKYRETCSTIKSFEEVQTHTGISEETLDIASAFLTIEASDNPLDKVRIPISLYPLVNQILKTSTSSIHELLGNKAKLKVLDLSLLVSKTQPLVLISQVCHILGKPYNIQREKLKPIVFNTAIKTLADLEVDSILDGIVGNITSFGAFVNIGLEQDGLIHISEMPNAHKQPKSLPVKKGDKVQVRVVSTDTEKKRINLSLNLKQHPTNNKKKNTFAQKKRPIKKSRPPVNSAMADALKKLQLSRE